MLLARFSLRYQIGLIGALGILGLGLFGGLYYRGSSTESAYRAASDRAAQDEQSLLILHTKLLELRRNEKDFLLRKNPDYAAKHAAVAGDVAGRLTSLRAALAATQDDEAAKQLDVLAARFADYTAQFATVTARQTQIGFNEESGLQGALRAAVHGIETLLNENKDDRLTILMLMMRRHEKDFLARVEAKYGDEMKKRATEFTTSLAAAALPPAVKTAIGEKLAAYQRDFFQMFDTSLAMVGEVKKLSEIYAATEPVVAQITQRIETRYRETQAAMTETRAALTQQLSWSFAILFVLLAAVATALTRAVVGPLSGLTATMKRLATGDTAVDMVGTTRGDEIGAMAQAVQVFKDNAIAMARMQDEQEALKRQAESDKRQALETLASGFEASVQGIVDAISAAASEMEETAKAMSATAEETSRQATVVGSAAEEASVSVETVAAASEELSSSITEISRRVAQAASIAGKAADESAQTDETVNGLSQAANKIGEVVALINDIASQTNLLALNATIEAARAGEAGKGFAVVASEVKSLATQTARATEEIKAQISTIQGETKNAVSAIQHIGGTIGEINEIAAAIADAVEEQGAATQEIARNIQQAATGTGQVSANIGGVASAAGETGAAATQVLASASGLALQSGRLRSEVDKFLVTVRAG
jgi:methyl-accepting chemotaxis protein